MLLARLTNDVDHCERGSNLEDVYSGHSQFITGCRCYMFLLVIPRGQSMDSDLEHSRRHQPPREYLSVWRKQL